MAILNRKIRPIEQISMFLSWFGDQGVKYYDVHIRKPAVPGADYQSGLWIWLCHNERVSATDVLKRLLPWLRYENANGSDIYFRPHGEMDHRIVFLDDVSLINALKVANKYTACVVETSRGNTQVWPATDRPLNKHARKNVQQSLSKRGYSDPGSVSGDHLGRLCGFSSMKHGTWVNLTGATTVVPYTPDIFNIAMDISPQESRHPGQKPGMIRSERTKSSLDRWGACASKRMGICDTSFSGREWGWIMGMLKAGMNVDEITNKLIEASDKRGKKHADRYARNTIRKACKELRISNP